MAKMAKDVLNASIMSPNVLQTKNGVHFHFPSIMVILNF